MISEIAVRSGEFSVLPFLEAGSPTPAVPVILLEQAAFDGWRDAQPEQVRRWADAGDFAARAATILLVPGAEGAIGQVICGLGDPLPAEGSPWPFAKLASLLPPGTYEIASPLSAAAAYHAALGWGLQHYRFRRYRTEDPAAEPRRLILPAQVDAADLERMLSAVSMLRDLVNVPAADLGPAEIATAAADLAREHDAEFREIVGPDLLAERLHLIHAVGRAAGAERAPRLIDLRWGAAGRPLLTIVGKGVCFDSGGLDLKPSSAMRIMKKDMGGAAHALALARLVIEGDLPVRLRLLIPAVENAIGGDAFRPGDILQSRAGLTVEIDNTDAEGRLILADALTLADEEEPDLLIDFATLTGAARVALGTDIPPFFTDDDGLAAALDACARREADPLWRLPLWTPYMDDLKSDVADTANCSSSGFAGCITAALFLRKFVKRTANWVHMDVYAWNRSARPGRPTGGEAQGLRAVYRLLEDRYR